MYVVIYGMSGSGKTTISQELQNYLEENSITSTILPLDLFYKEGNIESYDTPKAFDWKKLWNCLYALYKNRPYTLHHYNYSLSQYQLNSPIIVQNADVIIIEGIYAHYAKFLLLDEPFVIHINTKPDLCLIRRLIRDESCRGIPMKETIKMWKEKVRPDWDKWNTTSQLQEHALSPKSTIGGTDEEKNKRQEIYEIILQEWDKRNVNQNLGI